MSVRKSVGNITAYAATVKGGYTGTYEEFCAEQANFAKNAQKVAEDRAAVEKIKTDTQDIKEAAVKEVGDAKNEALTSIGNTARERLTAIQTAGAAQVEAVQDAGALKVEDVENAGTAERAALDAAAEAKTAEAEAQIEEKGAEVLATIPEDYTETVKKVGELSEEIADVKSDIIKPQYFITEEVVNLYDNENPVILSGYITDNGLIEHRNFRSLEIAVQPNTTYTLSLNCERGRISVSCFVEKIVKGATPIAGIQAYSYTYNNRRCITFTTSETTYYIGVYYCHADDIEYEAEIRENLRLDIGDRPSCGYAYTPTYDVDVNSVRFADTIQLFTGVDHLAVFPDERAPTLGYAWTMENGVYTYTGNGVGSALNFGRTYPANTTFIVEFDISNASTDAVSVGFGDGYKTINYNGTNHNVIFVRTEEVQDRLTFTALIAESFSISNVICKPVQASGEPITVQVDSFLTKHNNNNFGYWNVLLGKDTGKEAVGITRSIAIGNYSLRDIKGGNRNIGIGTYSLSKMTDGEQNIAIGCDNMLGVLKAKDCVSIGFAAMNQGASHTKNVAIGSRALGSSGGAVTSFNTAIGYSAGIKTKNNGNTYVGTNAGYYVTTGKNNTLLGLNSEGASSGDGNTCIGHNSGYSDGVSNSVAVGQNAKSTKSNQMVLGDSNITEVVICGNKKINFNADGTVTWETIE